MGLLVLVSVMICSLIWWFTSEHSFDMLGRMIMIAGGIMMAVGIVSVWDGHGFSILGKDFSTIIAHSRQTGEWRQKIRDEGSHMGVKVVIFFLGSGLLCLFIGNLITLGL